MQINQHGVLTLCRAIGTTWVILLALGLAACDRDTRPLSTVTWRPTLIMQTPASPTFSATLTPVQRVGAPIGNEVTPLPTTASSRFTPTTAIPQGDRPSPRRTRYILSATMNYQQHRLTVSQTVEYVSLSQVPLPGLTLVVEPNRQAGVFRLNELKWADGQPIQGYKLDGAVLHVPLRSPLLPGASIRLYLSFELNVPPCADHLGYTMRQMNLGDWYPFVPPYRTDQGWLVHEPAQVGEHLVYDVADYQVDISLAGSANGLVIAASVPAAAYGNTYHYQLDAARSFALSLSSQYRVISMSVNSVTVVGYMFPEHLSAGKAATEATARALSLYSNIFSRYPHTSLAVVEADFADGMEYEGLYFLGQEYYAAYSGNPRGYLTAIAVHETAHQWWYGLVGNDQATEPWLDEALATYSELLFYESTYPDLVDWWWSFRVTRFNPVGWVNSTIYDHDNFRPYVNAVYLRGALFIRDLRNLMGDKVFFAFLQDYADTNAYRQVTTRDFFAILNTHSASDSSVLKSNYFAYP